MALTRVERRKMLPERDLSDMRPTFLVFEDGPTGLLWVARRIDTFTPLGDANRGALPGLGRGKHSEKPAAPTPPSDGLFHFFRLIGRARPGRS